MRCALGIAACLAACRFHGPGVGTDEPPIDGATGDDAPGDAAAVACPNGWIALPNSPSRYLVVSNSDEIVSWHNAEQRCESMGAGIHLLVIGSQDEATGIAASY